MKAIVEQQHTFFNSGQSLDVSYRKKCLGKLKSLLQQHEEQIFDALEADFRKPAFETYETELLPIFHEIDYLLDHLADWAKPEKANSSVFSFPSKSYIHSQPYGVSLIIGAWNYPIHLTIAPLLGSIAAGNCSILKPSELAPHSSSLMAELINSNFDDGYLHVVEGDAETTQQLLDQPLDHIFFTGSTRVGKIIMKAAAEQLTPVTLELGGKSPTIIDQTADLALAAKRIAWGKFINAGQTCVSPDYVYIHESKRDEFCQLLGRKITEFYGSDPSESNDFARILNQRHFKRLQQLIDHSKVRIGGQTVPEENYIAPTVMTDMTWEDPIMQDEIFGPILPILTFENINEVIRAVRSKPKPLALYLFSTDTVIQERIINEISFGGGCINDTIMHLGNYDLPFGGIGQSGFGSYHGKHSFDTFSHQKSVMKKSNWLDIPLRYPPYSGKLKWLKRLTKYL